MAAEYGDSLAAPSPLEAIPHDPEVEEAARILVRAAQPGKAVWINFTLDEGLFAKNRSGFLALRWRRCGRRGWGEGDDSFYMFLLCSNIFYNIMAER